MVGRDLSILFLFYSVKHVEDRQILAEIKQSIDFRDEYAWLKEMLIGLNSPVVFCHNDVQVKILTLIYNSYFFTRNQTSLKVYQNVDR